MRCAVVIVSFLIATVLAYLVLWRGNSPASADLRHLCAYVPRTRIYLIGFCLIVFAITADYRTWRSE